MTTAKCFERYILLNFLLMSLLGMVSSLNSWKMELSIPGMMYPPQTVLSSTNEKSSLHHADPNHDGRVRRESDNTASFRSSKLIGEQIFDDNGDGSKIKKNGSAKIPQNAKTKKQPKKINTGVVGKEKKILKMPKIDNTKIGGLKRIVNGEEARPPHSLPWQAGLVSSNNPKDLWCGATILCPKFLMTAAHCVNIDQNNPRRTIAVTKYKVIVGVHNLDDAENSMVLHDIKKYHLHPKWTPAAGHDLTLIELKKPIKLKKEAMAVYLPDPKDNYFSGGALVVSGWGDTEHCDDDCIKAGMTGKASHVLLVTSLPPVSDSECMRIMKPVDKTINESAMCAGKIQEMSTDACQGDSGGPLAWLDKATGKVKLVGVVSQGVKCATPGYPGLYGKMTHVLKWVKKIIGKCNEKTCKKDKCMTRAKLKSAERHFCPKNLPQICKACKPCKE